MSNKISTTLSTNPGNIYTSGTVEDIKNGIQSFRNPGLVILLNKLGYIENYGTGIKRIREAYPYYDIRTFLINSRQWFRVTLPDLNHEKSPLGDNVPQNVPQTDLDKIIVAIRKTIKSQEANWPKQLAKVLRP